MCGPEPLLAAPVGVVHMKCVGESVRTGSGFKNFGTGAESEKVTPAMLPIPSHIACVLCRARWGTVDTFCIFNHSYFISSPNKLKICHTKHLYIHNIMPKHENNAFQKKFYNQFKKGTFLSSVPHAWGTPDRSKKVGLHALHNVHVISHVK